MGLPFFPQHGMCTDADILTIIKDLYATMHAHETEAYTIQKEIDRYWIALFLRSIRSPLLDCIPWQSFVLKLQDVFNVQHLPDIGYYIRQLSINRNISENVMCRIIQYSLPYVKHNRLNFPRYADVPQKALIELIQITLAMLMSIYPHSTKHALWQLRFKIYVYTYILISQGNKYDQYLWCINNINLIRIGMIEYFVYFVNKNMPAEFEVLQSLFGASNSVQVTFRQFLVNIEYFRTQNLQSLNLNWVQINKKSHYIIERCNRLCKTKPKMMSNCMKYPSSMHYAQDINSILETPRCKHPCNAKMFNPDISFENMQQVYHIHQNIYVQKLPRSIWQIQRNSLLQMMRTDSFLYRDCMYLYICFRCIHMHPNILPQMRIDTYQNRYCQFCDQSDAIKPINVLGQIASVFEKRYYFCHQCLLVHEWTSSGCEFFTCPFFKTEKKVEKSDCLLCKRSLNVNNIDVLDSHLGVMHSIALCTRHIPREHQMQYIYCLSALVQCLKKRQEYRLGIA